MGSLLFTNNLHVVVLFSGARYYHDVIVPRLGKLCNLDAYGEHVVGLERRQEVRRYLGGLLSARLDLHRVARVEFAAHELTRCRILVDVRQ